MKLSMPITKKKIRNHFAYSWWKYLLLVVIAVFGWNLLQTTTRYRSPEHLKVEWYSDRFITQLGTKDIYALMDELHQTLLPDMEEVTFTEVGLDDQYGDMQLMVWSSAGQGDVYLLSLPRFTNLAKGGALVDLQPYIDDGTINVDGIDLSNGYIADDETGKMYLVGIPADMLTGFLDYGIITEDTCLCLLANGGNIDNALKLFGYMLDNMRAAE